MPLLLRTLAPAQGRVADTPLTFGWGGVFCYCLQWNVTYSDPPPEDLFAPGEMVGDLYLCSFLFVPRADGRLDVYRSDTPQDQEWVWMERFPGGEVS